MNMKKILSSALVAVTLFASVAGLIPVRADAAQELVDSGVIDETNAEVREKKVTAAYNDYDQVFTTAEERLNYEKAAGDLVSVSTSNKRYTIYVNRYTGMMYYRNNVTGQILTSNPISYAGMSDSAKDKLMSQISIKYSMDNGTTTTYANGIVLSAPEAAKRGQISVSYIAGGIRVNYTLGDTTTRYNVPMQIMEEDFINDIFDPMIEYYENLFTDFVVPDATEKGITVSEDDYKFYAKDVYEYEKSSWGGKAETISAARVDEYGNISVKGLQTYLDATKAIATKVYPPETDYENPTRKAVNAAYTALYSLLTNFQLVEPANKEIYGVGGTAYDTTTAKINYYTENPDSTVAIYTCTKAPSDSGLITLQSNLANYAGYTVDQILEHEGKCLYESEVTEKFVFKCSLEYTFNSDGTLSVRLPVNSITFNEALYNLDSVTPLQYFTAGNLTGEGYVFMPDGSGSVVEHGDFYSEANVQNVSIKLSVYGDDYAYANPSGKHKEQVTMPVYGLVTKDTEQDMIKNNIGSVNDKGFFAILEEGASLASISVEFGGNETKKSAVFASYSPYPSDEYVSNSAVGGSTSTYTIVSDSKYTGSYVTRYVLLGEGNKYNSKDYAPTYVGMATYYRDYLKAKGELTAIEDLSDDLPLYIEALGSMDVVEKILTFPVTVSKPLTTFDDILTMYNELSDVTTKFKSKADEYREKAKASEDNQTLQNKYQKRAEEYDRLVADMESIKNINFKLTGFANGGMYYSYPTKVKWESACGGRRGFRDLIETAEELSVDGANLGIYPEFDFVYMTNSASGDGVSEQRDLSRMVDNRFASKQVYNSVLGIYESFYSMVISTDALDGFYAKFNKKYSKYDHKYLSVATLGSDLNSNLDRDNAINRDDSSENVIAILDKMANTDNYEVMTSVGNSYAIGYADHILDISTDSSHLIFSSYTVPFIGMVLHSYVSYAGSPINYAGSPDYEILRAIESGASLYYILCYENTEFMKEDELLNDYYGIDYQNWYDKLVQQYNVLNDAIGEYQDYEIVDHRVVLTERIIDDDEHKANYDKLKAEFVDQVAAAVEAAIDNAYNNASAYGAQFNLKLDTAKLIAQAAERFNVESAQLVEDNFAADIAKAVAYYTDIYNVSGATEIKVEAVPEYESKYDFVTDSDAFSDDYDHTDYTADNGRVAIVTYKHAKTGDTVSFVLNYNVYTVSIRLAPNADPIEIEKYDFLKIEG